MDRPLPGGSSANLTLAPTGRLGARCISRRRVRFKVMRRFANRWSLGKWRQRHSATGRFFRRPLKFAFRFASITITVANSEGNLKEAAVIETSHVTKNPQRECITLDRTPR